MDTSRRVLLRVMETVAGLGLIALGVFLARIGLDSADKLASIIGAFVGLIGLLLAGYATARTRLGRQRAGGQHTAPQSQAVTGSTVGGDITQVRGVRGDVRIGPPSVGGPGPGAPPVSRPLATPRADGGQAVEATSVSGAVRQVDAVDGDVDIDR